VESFVSELVHLGLFRQTVETSGEKSEDVHIRLWFAKTEYSSTQYVLYVEMQIEDQRGISSRRYVADSRNSLALVKGDQYGRALLKTAAATDLMEKLIPDVEEWLRQDQATREIGETPTAAAQGH
jgi:hypothetical protein